MEAIVPGEERTEAGLEALPSPAAATALLDAEFDAFYATVYRYLLHRVFDAELAEELTAESLYRLARSIRRVRPRRREMQMWLLRIATNLANSHQQRLHRRRLLLKRWLKGQATTMTVAASHAASDSAAQAARVRSAVAALPTREQAVIVLRYYSQLEYEDIAGILRCQPDAVRTRLSRAIKRLRERLKNVV
jgi:RNA polymerase sigma-70 factor (ECF subfamily)